MRVGRVFGPLLVGAVCATEVALPLAAWGQERGQREGVAYAQRPMNLQPSGRMGPPGGPRWPTPAEREQARNRIGITLEQEKRIDQLYLEFGRKRRAVTERLHALHGRLREQYDSYSIDRKRAAQVRAEILRVREQSLRLLEENEEQMRKILDRDQFTRMRAMMREEWEKRRADRRNRGFGSPPGPARTREPGGP